MKELIFMPDFDVEEVTSQLNDIMSRWSVQFLDINGPTWVVYDYDMEIRYIIRFVIDFSYLETRIKLEDLKLNVIHHIESLRDETTYRDNLLNHPTLRGRGFLIFFT